MNNAKAQSLFLIHDHGLHNAALVASGLACREGADVALWIAVVAYLDHLIELNPEVRA